MSYTFGSDAMLNAFNNDHDVEALFAVKADIQAMLDFEYALICAQARMGIVAHKHAEIIKDTITKIEIDENLLIADFKNDGVAPPSIVRQLRVILDENVRPALHLGATSQDLIDSSLMMRLRRVVIIVDKRLVTLDRGLDALVARSADGKVLKARTRMQNALPISVAEKVGNWKSQISNLKRTKPNYFPLQLGGPEGAARNFGKPYDALCTLMAETLKLDAPDHHWQTDRQPLMAIVAWFSAVASAVGKIAQDILMMAQTEIAEVTLATGGSSSAMSHKKNPVLAEVIVAQARFCHTQMAGLHTASIHENERSGAAWTLEWMLLPAMIITASKSVLNLDALIGGMQFRSS